MRKVLNALGLVFGLRAAYRKGVRDVAHETANEMAFRKRYGVSRRESRINLIMAGLLILGVSLLLAVMALVNG